jgi:23S rRNA pseudouridine1911/1915/1917 synthase
MSRVLRVVAGGAAALVEWRLATGRTHQIRVHARHLGCPLLGDGDYGGAGPTLTAIGRGSKRRCGTHAECFL